jgi:hypothetical protein
MKPQFLLFKNPLAILHWGTSVFLFNISPQFLQWKWNSLRKKIVLFSWPTLLFSGHIKYQEILNQSMVVNPLSSLGNEPVTKSTHQIIFKAYLSQSYVLIAWHKNSGKIIRWWMTKVLLRHLFINNKRNKIIQKCAPLKKSPHPGLLCRWAEMAHGMPQLGLCTLSCLCSWLFTVMGEGNRLFAVLRKINFHLQKMKLPSKILT